MAGAVPVALPLLHNVKYVLKEVLWEDTATVLSEVLPTEKAAAEEVALTRIPTTARQVRGLENAAETVRIDAKFREYFQASYRLFGIK